MTGPLHVRGADRLSRTLHDAGAELTDLSDVNRRVGELVVSRARSRTPVGSGRLVSSLKSTGTAGRVEMGSSLVYAGPIHNGWPAHHIAANPFLSDAARSSEDQWLDLYMGELDDVLAGVQGV